MFTHFSINLMISHVFVVSNILKIVKKKLIITIINKKLLINASL